MNFPAGEWTAEQLHAEAERIAEDFEPSLKAIMKRNAVENVRSRFMSKTANHIDFVQSGLEVSMEHNTRHLLDRLRSSGLVPHYFMYESVASSYFEWQAGKTFVALLRGNHFGGNEDA